MNGDLDGRGNEHALHPHLRWGVCSHSRSLCEEGADSCDFIWSCKHAEERLLPLHPFLLQSANLRLWW